MSERRLLLIGGGGHCRSVLDCVTGYDRVGIVERDGAEIDGTTVVGTDGDLERLYREGWNEAFITVGSVGSPALRRKLYARIKEIGFRLPVIVDPTAVLAGDVSLAEGCFVGKKAVLNVGSRIGVCAIINTGAIVEHDCDIGAFAHISPGATLCGNVRIGEDTHVGAGSVVRQGLSIENDVLIGMGSVVVKELPAYVRACGNPCRVMER